MSAGLKVYSLAEVAEHNTPESCWIVMDNKVYDVTSFISEHPGGEEVITELAGKDATVAFDDVGHSRDAKDMAKDYLIGELSTDVKQEAAKEQPKSDTSAVAPAANSLKDIFLSPTWTNFIIPSLIGVSVYVFYKAAVRVMS